MRLRSLLLLLLAWALGCVTGLHRPALAQQSPSPFEGSWAVSAITARDGNPKVGTKAVIEREPGGYSLRFMDAEYLWHLTGEGIILASAPGSRPYLTLVLSADARSIQFTFRPDGSIPLKKGVLTRGAPGETAPSRLAPAEKVFLVRAANETAQYLVIQGERRHIPTATAKVALGLAAFEARPISAEALKAIPLGPPLPEQEIYLVKGSDERQFLLIQGWKRHIPDPQTLLAMNLRTTPLRGLTDRQLERFPEAPAFPRLNAGNAPTALLEAQEEVLLSLFSVPDDAVRLRINLMRTLLVPRREILGRE